MCQVVVFIGAEEATSMRCCILHGALVCTGKDFCLIMDDEGVDVDSKASAATIGEMRSTALML